MESNFFCLGLFLSRYNRCFLSSNFDNFVYCWSSDCVGFHLAACLFSVCVCHCFNNGTNTLLTSCFHSATSFRKVWICYFLSLESNFFCLGLFLSRYNWGFYFLSSYFDNFVYCWSSDCVGFLNTTCFYSICIGNCVNDSANTIFTSCFHYTSSFWKFRICDFLSLEGNLLCLRFFLSGYNWGFYFLSSYFNNLIHCWSSDCVGFHLATCFNAVCVSDSFNNRTNTFLASCLHSANTFS